MSEQDKQNVEELLSRYIDGDLSQRRETELKRLILNDPSIEQQIETMRRQKELLGALPREKAPENLVENVRAALERKLILNEIEHDTTDETEGHRHLFLRRALTAAAVLVLTAVMVLVVYNILSPPKIDPGQVVKEEIKEIETTAKNEPADFPDRMREYVPDAPILLATLSLETRESIAVDAFMEKALFNNGLVECTVPRRRPRSSSYAITCGSNQIASLIDDMAAVWPKCSSIVFTVFDDQTDAEVEMAGISTDQLAQFLRADKGDDLLRYAKLFLEDNQIGQTQLAAGDAKPDRPLPDLTKPILTSPEDPEIKDRTEQKADTIFTITITGL